MTRKSTRGLEKLLAELREADLLMLVDVAEVTGRNVVDLRRWAREGRIPAIRIQNNPSEGAPWFMRRADLWTLDAIQSRSKPGDR